MGAELWDIFKEAALITLVVTALMGGVEALDFSGKGRIISALRSSRAGQLLLGGVLGATPGCVGGYVAVGLYSEGVISFGALLACFLATTGDEAFLMLARFPGKALVLFLGLLLGGILIGWLWDKFRSDAVPSGPGDTPLTAHAGTTHTPDGPDAGHDSSGLAASGYGPDGPNSGHGSSKLAVSGYGLTASSHGSDGPTLRGRLHHLLPHALKIFLWTFGVMAFVAVIGQYIDIKTWMGRNVPLMILLATAVGFIPQSGPHMIFVTLFAEGVIPLPVLLASSITQDGHAGLPLLAQSGRAFLRIKCLKAILALAISFALWALM